MEALVPTLVIALLAGVSDRPAAYLARVGTAWSAGGTLGLALLVQIAVAAVMAPGGWLVAPILNPNAKALLVAVALASAACGSLFKPVPRVDSLSTSGAPGVIAQLCAITATDRTAFIVFAFAARGPSPVLAAIGGVVGAGALAFIAITLGEAGWRKLPLPALARIAGSLLLIAALLVGLAALRLI